MSNEDLAISTPSSNPASNQDINGTLDFFLKQIFLKLEKVAPAQVISYNRITNRANIQILNYSITSTGEKISRKPLSNIPVAVFGGSLFGFGFPVKEGDIGFVIAADGDISVFKSLLKIFAPATYQKHKYKDGVFFPLLINGFTVSEDDKEAVVLSSIDGLTKISLKSGTATISAQNIVANATNIDLNGTLKINGQTYLSHTHSNGNQGSPTGGVIS